MKSTELVVISGMSGSGKTAVLRCFEDVGYYCIDHLPPPLLQTFVELCERASPSVTHIALVVDVRTREFLDRFAPQWVQVREGRKGHLMFLDADDSVLLQRFSETRRPHPLAPSGSVADGIRAERDLLGGLRELADRVIDTTDFSVRELRKFIAGRFGTDREGELNVAVTSFAFREGILQNADLVFDLRFLPNPHYDPDLRELTGLDKPVAEYVESRSDTAEFLAHLERMLDFLLPKYVAEGKSYVTLAFGCTGGRHRSVAIATVVARRLRERGYRTSLSHRDIPRAARE